MKLILVVLGILLLLLIGIMVWWTVKVYKLLRKFEKEAILEVSKAKIDFDETVKGLLNPIASVKNDNKMSPKMKEAEKWE